MAKTVDHCIYVHIALSCLFCFTGREHSSKNIYLFSVPVFTMLSYILGVQLWWMQVDTVVISRWKWLKISVVLHTSLMPSLKRVPFPFITVTDSFCVELFRRLSEPLALFVFDSFIGPVGEPGETEEAWYGSSFIYDAFIEEGDIPLIRAIDPLCVLFQRTQRETKWNGRSLIWLWLLKLIKLTG